MGRRTLLLVAAIVVAALGTVLVFAYVKNADNRALEDQEPVEVLVAKTLIKAGTLGSEAEKGGAFKIQKIPRAATIAGALGDPRPISELVAVSDIYPGEQIITAKFAQSGVTSLLAIPPGKVAMSIRMGDPERVAGFVQPGSEVAVFVTRPVRGTDMTRILLPRITVLAVGPTTIRPAAEGEGNKEGLPTAIVTFAADQVQAEKLIFMAQHSQPMYFALLTADSKISAGTTINENSVFS